MNSRIEWPHRAPKVSVFTPVFNRREYMAECADSVLGQSFRDFEYVIGDNASDDGTSQYLREIARTDPRVRLTRHDTNMGMIANANHVYANLRGEFAIMVCSDDLLLPGALEEMVGALEQHVDAVLATSPTVRIGPSGSPLPVFLPEFNLDVGGLDTVIDGLALARSMVREFKNLIGNPPLFRRSLVPLEMWREVNEKIPAAGDAALYVQLLARGPAVYLPRPLRAQREHPSQYSRGESTRVEVLIAMGKLVEIAREVGVLPYADAESYVLRRMLRAGADYLDHLDEHAGMVPAALIEELADALGRTCRRLAATAVVP